MSDYKTLANDLISALELSQPPIAISFCDAPPPNVPAFNGMVPAGCSFWQQAATRMFFTSTKDHELCAIGVHTHHMSQPSPSHQSELGDALAAMSGLDYVRAEEVAAIPVVQREVKHVVYGPLAECRSDSRSRAPFRPCPAGTNRQRSGQPRRQGYAGGDGTARLRRRAAGDQSRPRGHESRLLRRARLP